MAGITGGEINAAEEALSENKRAHVFARARSIAVLKYFFNYCPNLGRKSLRTFAASARGMPIFISSHASSTDLSVRIGSGIAKQMSEATAKASAAKFLSFENTVEASSQIES